MSKKLKIVTYILMATSFGLAIFLYKRLSTVSKSQKEVKKMENILKLHLIKIRDVEKAYQLKYKTYATSWDQIDAFVQKDSLYNIQKTEEIITRNFGNDSIVVHIDTISSVAVKDSLFGDKFSGKIANTLRYLPHDPTKEFIIRHRKSEDQQFIEIQDAAPINEDRRIGRMDTLKIGSLQEVTLKGNWEK